MKLSDYIPIIAEIKIRLDRGNSLIYWFRNIVIIIAGMKFIIELDILMTLLLGILLIFVIYFLGWIDLKYIKLFQKEAELATGKYNPYFKKTLG